MSEPGARSITMGCRACGYTTTAVGTRPVLDLLGAWEASHALLNPGCPESHKQEGNSNE